MSLIVVKQSFKTLTGLYKENMDKRFPKWKMSLLNINQSSNTILDSS